VNVAKLENVVAVQRLAIAVVERLLAAVICRRAFALIAAVAAAAASEFVSDYGQFDGQTGRSVNCLLTSLCWPGRIYLQGICSLGSWSSGLCRFCGG